MVFWLLYLVSLFVASSGFQDFGPDALTNQVVASSPLVPREDEQRRQMRVLREEAFGWLARFVTHAFFQDLFPVNIEDGGQARKRRSVPSSIAPALGDIGATTYGAILDREDCRKKLVCLVSKATQVLYPLVTWAFSLMVNVLPILHDWESLQVIDGALFSNETCIAKYSLCSGQIQSEF